MSAKDERGHITSERTGDAWEPIIGLEVHAQLLTRTKLFCGCKNTFGDAPNTHTCPVCTGQPGALPVLNDQAVGLAVRAAHAVGATIAPISKFDRKNYFYCDLPKGYQISQFDEPFCAGGGVQLPSGPFVRLTRIHMEEDAGKAIHDRGDTTLVDLNRAGVPLIESVTEADMRSSQEAFEYLTGLKEILRFSGVSDCDMEKGSLRCDVNVSVHRPGEPWGTKVEIKNLNSFRQAKDAIDHEIPRQIAALEAIAAGEDVPMPAQETRLWDVAAGITRTMRAKEDAHDYRYFPEPDLPLLKITDSRIAQESAAIPELPVARRERYQSELGLSAYDAGVLTGDRALADFFEETVLLSSNAKEACNWIANEVLRATTDAAVPGESIRTLNLQPSGLVDLMALIADGVLHNTSARKVLRRMLIEDEDAATATDALGLATSGDSHELEAWCRAALEGKDEVIADVRAGKEKAIGALIGPVMQASKGAANPQAVRETLLRLIADGDA